MVNRAGARRNRINEDLGWELPPWDEPREGLTPSVRAPDRPEEPEPATEAREEAENAEKRGTENPWTAVDGHCDRCADDQRSDHETDSHAVSHAVQLVREGIEAIEADPEVQSPAARRLDEGTQVAWQTRGQGDRPS